MMFAPPSRPRRRVGMPGYGSLYRRKSDARLFSVRKAWSRDLQVKLEAQVGTEKVYVFVTQLESDFTPEAV